MAQHENEPGAVWVLPDEPVPIRLMNTIWADRHGRHDALTGPDDLGNWLSEVGAYRHPPKVTGHEVNEARELRDALRRLAALRTADPRPGAASALEDTASAVAVVNRVAAGLDPPQLELSGDDLELSGSAAGRPVTAALADVAVEAVTLFTDPVAPPLRACLAPGCVLYFVQSHSRREWCSTACGNRARAARHYERHRGR